MISVRTAIAASAVLIASTAAPASDAWLQFRGSDNRSVSTAASLPVEWTGDDAAWKTALPGRCVSGPVVVQDRIVTTSSSGRANERLHVWCLAAGSGELLWQRSLWATGRTACHPLSSMASPTPASDGRRVYVLFASNDLVALDLDGNVRWLRGLGLERPQAFDDRGLGSSPLLLDGMLIIQVQCQGDPFVMGIETESGETRWTLPLAPTTNWTSPTLFSAGGRSLILLQGGQRVMLLDPRSGTLLAEYEPSGAQISSPTVAENRLFLPLRGLTALRFQPGSRELQLEWQSTQLAPQGPSPVYRDGRIYVLRNPCILVCGDAASGKRLWQIRLQGRGSYATPVLAGDHAYVVSQDGVAQVVNIAGEKPEVVTANEMGEEILASPAVVDGAIYLRGVSHLWKITPP